jgi:hypothetical protein
MWSAASVAGNTVKKHWRQFGVLLSVTLISLHSLSASYHGYREFRGQLRWRSVHGDCATVSEASFDRIKRELPATGLVGYSQAQSGSKLPWEVLQPFLIAQYALAPRVLVKDGRQDFNIAVTDHQVQLFRAQESPP